MGRPVQKKWFTTKAGSADGNLNVTTTSGDEPIIEQVGTGLYQVASGRVKLIEGTPSVAPDPANGVVGDAQLIHNGRPVWKINQYRAYYFTDDDPATVESDVWRDSDGNAIGTFVPALSAEGTEPDANVVTPEPVAPAPEPKKKKEAVKKDDDEPKGNYAATLFSSD